MNCKKRKKKKERRIKKKEGQKRKKERWACTALTGTNFLLVAVDGSAVNVTVTGSESGLDSLFNLERQTNFWK